MLKQVSANEFRPVVVELFADSLFLKQSNTTLLQSTFTYCPPNFTGEAFFYDWETNEVVGGNKFENGNKVATLYIPKDSVQAKIICLTTTKIVIKEDDRADDGTGSGYDSSGYPVTEENTECWDIPISDGGGYNGGSGNTGGWGYGDGGGILDPPPPPPPTDTEPPNVKATLKSEFVNNAKVMCIYNKIVQNPRVKELLKDFANPTLGFNLTMGLEPLYFPADSNYTEGATRATNHDYRAGQITINMDSNELANISEVHLAKNIIHEMIHAHILAKIALMGGLDSLHKLPELKSIYVSKKNFTLNIWDHNKAQHEYMAKVYFDDLVEILMEVDGNRMPKIYYQALAWEGLLRSNQYKKVNSKVDRDLIPLRWSEIKNMSLQDKRCN